MTATLVGLLSDAEHCNSRCGSTIDRRLDYLERRAVLLHRLVDAIGDEPSRYLAQDAEDRAEDLRARAEAMARECGAPLRTTPATVNAQAPRKI
ncbi:hypothetical protein [Streptomyces sp. NPDC094031]|uniref:hypothetical protein n=1 Tax=Streptomyces sp. NPDC094031 TaxID=3155307 RepID=UPI003331017D